jgi:type IV secretory pathway TrbD component
MGVEDQDDERRPPPRLMGAPFWIALAVGLACVALGAAVALWGARVFPPLAH